MESFELLFMRPYMIVFIPENDILYLGLVFAGDIWGAKCYNSIQERVGVHPLFALIKDADSATYTIKLSGQNQDLVFENLRSDHPGLDVFPNRTFNKYCIGFMYYIDSPTNPESLLPIPENGRGSFPHDYDNMFKIWVEGPIHMVTT